GDCLVTDDRNRRLLGDCLDLSRQYLVEAKRAMALVEEGRRDEALTHFRRVVAPAGARLATVSSEWIQYNKNVGSSTARAALDAIEETRSKALFFTWAALLLTGLLGFLTLRRIVTPIQALERSVKTIAAGDYTRVVPFIESTDETGGLARSIDVLKRGASAIDDQRWVKSSASSLVGELQGAASLAEFGQRLLSGLVPLLRGGVAGFYVFEAEANRLRRVAAYGLAANAEPTFGLGEGLVGQCASDRKPVTLTDFPAGH